MNTKGTGSIRRLVEVIATKWQRGVVLMADSDFRSDLESSGWIERFGLVEGTSLFFVGDREFEDAFSNEVWARALNQNFPVDGAEWISTDIEACRDTDKFSLSLVNEVKRRTRDSSVGKPDLGIALASCLETEAEVPQAVGICLTAAQTRATA